MRTAAVALLLVLAACSGGSSGSDAGPTTPAPTGAGASAGPVVPPPTGTPAPEALSRFRCEQDGKGSWNAAGYVANTGKAKATYQVTVDIGAADGTVERARTRRVPDVAAGGSSRFTLTGIPAPDTGGVCRVQVVVTS